MNTGIVWAEGVDQLVDLLMQRVHLLLDYPNFLVSNIIDNRGS